MKASVVVPALAAIFGVQLITDAAVIVLGRREHLVTRWLPFLVSGAAGVLLATACLDLLPDAMSSGTAGRGMWEILLGSLLVLCAIQTLAHRLSDRAIGFHASAAEPATAHTHLPPHSSAATHSEGTGAVTGAPVSLLLGSALHSGIDGIAIMAAFLANRRAGWSAAFAVGLHELPHRMSDFALLVHMGITRRRAAQLAIGAGGAALAGGLAVALLGEHRTHVPWSLPISAATFLYIALVDLMPGIQANRQHHGIFGQLLAMYAGAGLVFLLVTLSAG